MSRSRRRPTAGPSHRRPRFGRARWWCGSPRRAVHRFLSPVQGPRDLVQDAPDLTLREVWRLFWPDVRPLRWWVALSTALGSILSAITVIEIALFKFVVDDVLVPADLRPLVWIGGCYLALAVVSGILSGLNSYLSTWLSHTFLTHLRTRVFAHVLSLPQEVHDRRRLGDSMLRITSDSSSVESFMIGRVRSGITTVLTAAFYLVALMLLDVQLALASLVIVPIFWLLAHRFARLIKVTAREQRRRGGSLSAITEEHLGNAALVQTFNRHSDATEQFMRENLGIRAASLAATRVRAVFSPVVDLAELVGVLTVIVLGTYSLASGRLTLGGLLAFMTMMVQLYGPMRSLGGLYPGLFGDAAGCERLAELLDETPPVERSGAEPLREGSRRVSLEHVTVVYPGARRAALDNVTLHFEPDIVIAVVGPSGAGKSTLVKLLLRAVDPTAGAVLVGGQDLRDVTLHSVRDNVALVPQEMALLDASVRDNIAYARHGASDADIVQAARAATADEFIRALPRGYETTVGQRARTLSGGQRQRVSLARAFLKDSPLLLLDEPTTGLDPEAARRVLQPLRDNRQPGHTIIMVTHDPVAVEMADRVVTLDHGRVVSDVVTMASARRSESA